MQARVRVPAVPATSPGKPLYKRPTFWIFVGLGLGVVRNVCRRFNGSVKLEEPKHGKGARFVLRLPIAE